MDRGEERIDPDVGRQLLSQAKRIHVESLVAATLLTGVAMLVGAWVAGLSRSAT